MMKVFTILIILFSFPSFSKVLTKRNGVSCDVKSSTGSTLNWTQSRIQICNMTRHVWAAGSIIEWGAFYGLGNDPTWGCYPANPAVNITPAMVTEKGDLKLIKDVVNSRPGVSSRDYCFEIDVVCINPKYCEATVTLP